MFKKKLMLSTVFLSLTACGTHWQTTHPKRTALEQVLLTTAAERAIHQFSAVKPLTKYQQLGPSYIDTQYFKSYEQQYILHCIRRYFLESGIALVDESHKADTIIEVAAGGLSIDNSKTMIGLPTMSIPIPFAGNIDIPEIALYKNETDRSLAKFSVTFRDAKQGHLISPSITAVGTAHNTAWTVLLLFDFIKNDLQLPKYYNQLGDY